MLNQSLMGAVDRVVQGPSQNSTIAQIECNRWSDWEQWSSDWDQWSSDWDQWSADWDQSP